MASNCLNTAERRMRQLHSPSHLWVYFAFFTPQFQKSETVGLRCDFVLAWKQCNRHATIVQCLPVNLHCIVSIRMRSEAIKVKQRTLLVTRCICVSSSSKSARLHSPLNSGSKKWPCASLFKVPVLFQHLSFFSFDSLCFGSPSSLLQQIFVRRPPPSRSKKNDSRLWLVSLPFWLQGFMFGGGGKLYAVCLYVCLLLMLAFLLLPLLWFLLSSPCRTMCMEHGEVVCFPSFPCPHCMFALWLRAMS
jgi:hypothetical protein